MLAKLTALVRLEGMELRAAAVDRREASPPCMAETASRRARKLSFEEVTQEVRSVVVVVVVRMQVVVPVAAARSVATWGGRSDHDVAARQGRLCPWCRRW